MKRTISTILTTLLIISILPLISATGANYCCEQTTYGAWCQEAPQDQCADEFRKAPTSCESTSFCKEGCCYDSSEGTCMDSTPQKVCQDAQGTWEASPECEIPQCDLGCCVLGQQASFVTLTRCKKLSSFYGLNTDFRTNIGDELSCISLASLSDEGACVFEADYQNTCRYTSRQECNTINQGSSEKEGIVSSNVTFYKDLLCSAEELGTNCGPTEDTTCVEGKDEVYFIDSCGNIANIYDATKVTDKAYWRKKVAKEDACGSGTTNTNSRDCGNCDYFGGSICKDYKAIDASRPTYGDFICSDLNCKASETSDKQAHKHGESWCSTDGIPDSPGSRYFRHLCINGEEIIEPCADYRQEICIQDAITETGVVFSQAACRVNRWEDCSSQGNAGDCTNKDRRDCKWIGDKCVPEHAPGFKFWESGEAQGLCSQGNAQEVVDFVKEGYFLQGGEECKKNCNALTEGWKQEQISKCEGIGDCGNKQNFIGIPGNGGGWTYSVSKVKNQKNDN